MRSVRVVVTDVFREQSFQMAFIHGDHMIQRVTSATFDPTFHHAVLPGPRERGPHGAHLQVSNGCGDLRPYFASRSKIINLDVDSKGNASRNCWMIQLLVGCFVTLKCRIRRR
jgi:hypothetical protein